jgi:nitrate reductase gamma subunit
MHVLFSLIAVVALVFAAYFGVRANLYYLFGLIIPLAAIVIFIAGFIHRIVKWARTPVPFKIPTTCGQQKSLDFVEHNELESPSKTSGVIGRMALEILAFRSLFRNTKSEVRPGDPLVTFAPTKWLWAAAIVFHYAFLVIFLRHFKFFVEPVPVWVGFLQDLDSFFQVGLPIVYITNIAILAALGYLLLRRLYIPQLRYISLSSDYFPLFLILGIVISGVYMRYFGKVDVVSIKMLATGLISGNFVSAERMAMIGAPFYVHLLMVATLLVYFPLSKLMHMPGVFMSPTRNMPNDNRAVRHVNPWNYPVKVHSYDAYEDEFRELMKAVDLPVERDAASEGDERKEQAKEAAEAMKDTDAGAREPEADAKKKEE